MKKAYSVSKLPEGYSLWDEIDMKHNGKLVLWLNILSLMLFLPFFPILFRLIAEVRTDHSVFLWLLISMGGLIVVHEGIHAVFFRCFSKEGKVAFKFHGWAFSASMEGHFFSPRAYAVIGAAPVVILSVVLAILGLWGSSDSLRSFAWFLFAMQFSSAAGDFYVLWRFRRLPEDALLEDTGIGMKVFSRTPRS